MQVPHLLPHLIPDVLLPAAEFSQAQISSFLEERLNTCQKKREKKEKEKKANIPVGFLMFSLARKKSLQHYNQLNPAKNIVLAVKGISISPVQFLLSSPHTYTCTRVHAATLQTGCGNSFTLKLGFLQRFPFLGQFAGCLVLWLSAQNNP